MRKMALIVVVLIVGVGVGAGMAMAAGSDDRDPLRSSAPVAEALTGADALFARVAVFVDGNGAPGSFTVRRGKGVAAVTNPITGVYCIRPGVPGMSVGKVIPAVVAVDFSTSANNDATAQWRSSRPHCGSGQLEINTFHLTTGAFENDTGFTLVVP